METVAELKTVRGPIPSVSRLELKLLDERIFNCECSIARFEIVIMETEAKRAVLLMAEKPQARWPHPDPAGLWPRS